MVLFSFNSSKSTANFTGFSLKWYQELFSSGSSMEALKNTLIERIDAIETTLAHIVPEFTANLLVPLIITAVISIILGIFPNAGLHLFDLAVMAGNQIFMPYM